MENIGIAAILEQVNRGQIRIPAFQRGFVWDSDRVAYLMDSIYKKYPFGSLLFWRTKEKLKIERDLGPFILPEPKDDYPVDYVLDGQQRITSIFGTFQTGLATASTEGWLDIYFDLSTDENAQDTQFVALPASDADPAKYFPIKTFFNSTDYRHANKSLSEAKAQRVDKVFTAFQQTQIPVQISRTEDKATVAIIFERINRQGVELDTLQLLSAWTWSEDFQLQEQFRELTDEMEPFGFAEVGGDNNLLLRCCSAVLTLDASPGALMGLNGSSVRENFDSVMNGVKYAVDYCKRHFFVETLANLPFTTLLVPLSVFFAVPGSKEKGLTDRQRRKIDRWFWRACFTKRYSSGVLRNLNSDIVEMARLRDEGDSALGDFAVDVDENFFLNNQFGMGNVNTKTFILMLASEHPLSFKSGSPIDLAITLKASNRAEFHHLMPKAFLRDTGQHDPSDSVLANFVFLSRADNRDLGGAAPSAYRAKMPKDVDHILAKALVPSSLFNDEYVNFLIERLPLLLAKAKTLCDIEKSE